MTHHSSSVKALASIDPCCTPLCGCSVANPTSCPFVVEKVLQNPSKFDEIKVN